MKTKRALYAFYENLAHEHHDVEYYLNPIGISRRAEILALIQGGFNELIGDFGCGDGLIAKKLRNVKRRVVGCDLSLTRVLRAKTIGIDEVTCADAMQLPFTDACFDWVICSEVIEHVIDPTIVLGEIYRVLRPCGSTVLTVPLDEKLKSTLLDVPEENLSIDSYKNLRQRFQLKGSHLTSFSENSFKELVISVGFQVDAVRYTYNYTLRHSILWQCVRIIYSIMERLLPLKRYPSLLEAIMHPFIWASYQKEQRVHHVVMRAIKNQDASCNKI